MDLYTIIVYKMYYIHIYNDYITVFCVYFINSVSTMKQQNPINYETPTNINIKRI